MCPPPVIAALSIAASVAQGAVGYMGQQQAYKAQVEGFNQNVRSARQATFNQWNSSQLRISQEGEAATQAKQEAAIQTAKSAATAATAAGEGGVSGLSVDYLVHDLYAQRGRHDAAVDSNLQMTRSYLSGEMEAQRAQGQNQINSMPVPEKPSILPTLVGVFGSAVGTYSDYKANKRT
jgi:hypothetical protein